jgi:hypothetical protein
MYTLSTPDDPWVKVVGMLQHNWALIDAGMTSTVSVFFFHDGSGIFGEMSFESGQDAVFEVAPENWTGC